MLSWTVRPSCTAATIEAKLSSSSTIPAASLAASVPLRHGDADIGLLQGRRVVDAVARHSDDLALGLQGADDAQLVLRARAREHTRTLHDLLQRGVGEPVQVVAGEDVRGVAQPELPGDRRRCRSVVAGDHLHRDPRRAALGDGRHGLLPRRVDEADDAQKHEPVLDIRERQADHGIGRGLHGEGQHALAFGGSSGDARGPEGMVEGNLDVALRLPGAHLQHTLRRAFDQDDPVPVGSVVQRRHEAVLGVERDLV
jgi:hypothetical protein